MALLERLRIQSRKRGPMSDVRNDSVLFDIRALWRYRMQGSDYGVARCTSVIENIRVQSPSSRHRRIKSGTL